MSRQFLAALAILAAAQTAAAQAPATPATPVTPVTPTTQRFLIEREIPGASKMSAEEFRNGAAKSNAVLRDLGPDIQWVHSYVAGDKVYCVYQAPSEALIRLHAERSGFPASKVTPITTLLDPTTANRR